MMAQGIGRAAALALIGSMMLLTGGTAEAASSMKCRKTVESAWAEAKIDKSDIVATTARESSAGGVKMADVNVYARLKTCSGTVVVSLSKACHLRSVYTTGDYRLPGVPSYP